MRSHYFSEETPLSHFIFWLDRVRGYRLPARRSSPSYRNGKPLRPHKSRAYRAHVAEAERAFLARLAKADHAPQAMFRFHRHLLALLAQANGKELSDPAASAAVTGLLALVHRSRQVCAGLKPRPVRAPRVRQAAPYVPAGKRWWESKVGRQKPGKPDPFAEMLHLSSLPPEEVALVLQSFRSRRKRRPQQLAPIALPRRKVPSCRPTPRPEVPERTITAPELEALLEPKMPEDEVVLILVSANAMSARSDAVYAKPKARFPSGSRHRSPPAAEETQRSGSAAPKRLSQLELAARWASRA